jgi:dephospho-CoA kinase
LIGGIGAGKSLVADEFKKRGAFVLDADAVGHALLDQPPAREEVLRRFGTEVLDRSADGSPQINRRALGAVVFAHDVSRRDLEKILHPRMRGTFERAIARTQRKRQVPLIVLDAAVLFEAGWNELCDVVLFVDAPREQRLARLESQRGWTAEVLEAREKAQLPLDQKRTRADFVIVNDGGTEHLSDEVARLWDRLCDQKRPTRSTETGSPEDAG